MELWYKLLWIFLLLQGRRNTHKEGEIPCGNNNYEASATYQAHQNFLLPSFSCILQIFVPHLLKWSKPRYLKAEALQVPQKVQTMLFLCLLSGIRTSVYLCTGFGTSKIHLCPHDNRLSISAYNDRV